MRGRLYTVSYNFHHQFNYFALEKGGFKNTEHRVFLVIVNFISLCEISNIHLGSEQPPAAH